MQTIFWRGAGKYKFLSFFIFLTALIGLSFIFILSVGLPTAEAAVLIHSFSPARVSGSDPRTTASFNPPDNSLILAMVSSDSNLGSNPNVVISNNGTALIWNLIAERNKEDIDSQDGEASAFYALLPTARTNMRVTASITDQNQRISLKVYVITGHDLVNPIGALSEGSSTANNITPTIYTSTTNGSLGFAVANDWSAPGLPSSTDEENAFHIAGYISGLSAYKSAETTVAGTPVTMNFDASGTGAVKWNWVGFEVKSDNPPLPDTTPPTVSITAPTEGATVSGSAVTVSANASDNVAVAGVQFKLNGNNLGSEDTTSPYSITWDTTSASNASHTLTATARDAAGNATTSLIVTVTVINPLVISGILVSNITQTSATVNWNTNVPADSQVNYGTTVSYGLSTTLDSTLVTSHSQAITGLSASTTYNFQVLSKDAGGILATSGDNTFTTLAPPDTTPPTVSIAAPTEGATVSGSAVTVSANASDNVAVAGVQFKLDGVNLGAEDITSPYSIIWNTTIAANGLHALSATARDAAGNTANATSMNVTVNNTDTTPPVISSVASSSITSTGATITWSTNEASDSQVEYGTTTSYGSSSSLNSTMVTSHSVLLGGLSASTLYHYRVKSKDAAGNLATSGDFIFTTTASGNALSIDGNQIFQTIDGFGMNINSLSWKNGESAPAINLLADQMGVTTWRVVFDEMDWETTNDDGNPNTFNWTYYNSLYSNSKFQNLWGTLGHLNQKGFNSSIALSFMGIGPSWMGSNGTINTSMEDEFVETIASLIYYAKNTANVNFGILDPINEPMWDGIEGPMTDAPQLTRILNKLSVKLDSLGLSTIRFMAPETAGGFNTNFVGSLMSDPVVMNKIDHIAFHQYGGDSGGADAYIKSSAYSNKTFWVTEVTDPIAIISHIGQGPTSVMVWEGFDSVYNHAIRAGRGSTAPNDTQGLPNPPIAYDAGTGTYSTRPIFYQDAAIFKYVTPGARRISSNESIGGVTTYAFYNSSTGRFTIIGQNTGGSTAFTGTLNNLPSLTSLEFYRTDINALTRLSDVIISNNVFSFSAPSNTFFVLTGLAVTDTTPPTAPSNLNATGNLGFAALSWQAATDNIGVITYNIYRSITSGFIPSLINKIGQVANLIYTDLSAAGTYYYLITAQDAAGNIGPASNEASATITADTTSPNVSITAPTDGTTVSGSSVTVSANASDNVGVAGVQFKLDGNNLGTEDTVSPYSISWNTATSTNGSHNLTAIARDGADNTTTSLSVSVTVNNITLPIALVQNVSNNTSSGSSLSSVFASPVTSGNFVVVAVSGWPNVGTVAVTDNLNNTYTLAGNIQLTSGNSFATIFYAKNINGGNATVTLSNGVVGTQLSMVASEFSGVDRVSPLDAVAQASGSGNVPSSGNITPTMSGDLVIGAGTHDGTLVTSAGLGFTIIAIATEDSSSHQPLASEYKVTSSSSPLPADFSLSLSVPWAQVGALFKPAAQ